MRLLRQGTHQIHDRIDQAAREVAAKCRSHLCLCGALLWVIPLRGARTEMSEGAATEYR
jgi:hypothetical protein